MNSKLIVDVSKALFMDLAFLLIAALVLMVRDSNQSQQHAVEEAEAQRTTQVLKALKELEIRPAARIPRAMEAAIPGESLFLRVDAEGHVCELPVSGDPIPWEPGQLRKRVEEMKDQGERVVLLLMDIRTPYGKYQAVQDSLQRLQAEGRLGRVLEIVREDDAS